LKTDTGASRNEADRGAVKHPWLLFLGVATAPTMIGIDMLAIAVAIQPMARDLRVGISTVQWFLTAFALGNACLLVTAGRLSDIFGRKKTIIAGLILFICSSLAIAVSGSARFIVICRFIQGASGGVMATTGIAILMSLYEGEARADWISRLVGMAGLGLVLGPIVGGGLVHVFGWRSVFLINPPIGLACIALTVIHLPSQGGRAGQKLDVPGVLLLTAALLLLTMGLTQGHAWGWQSPKTLGSFLGAAILLAALLQVEARRDQPLIVMALFRVRNFLAANVAGFIAYFTFMASILIFGIYLQKVMGFSPGKAGLCFAPMGLTMAAASMAAGKAIKFRGAKPLIVAGFACGLAGFLGLSGMPVLPGWAFLAFFFALVGLGFGLVNASSIPAALEFIPPEQAGIGSGKALMIRWLGGAIGSAVISTVFVGATLAFLGRWDAAHPVFADPRTVKVLHDAVVGSRGESAVAALFTRADRALAAEAVRETSRQGMITALRVLAALSLAAGAAAQIWIEKKKNRNQEEKRT